MVVWSAAALPGAAVRGVPGDPKAGHTLAGGERYVVALGTVEPRKDLPTLVTAFDALAAADPDLRLVIAGQDGWGAEALTAGLDVADVGCGSGTALLLLAAEFPASRFSGFDISTTGIAGLTSFGQAAFVGLGAYTAAYLTLTYGVSPWLTVWVGVAVTAGVGGGRGLRRLRLPGRAAGARGRRGARRRRVHGRAEGALAGVDGAPSASGKDAQETDQGDGGEGAGGAEAEHAETVPAG